MSHGGTRSGGPGERTSSWFEVRRSTIQGKGAFALKRIPKGTRFAEYEGERITTAEADRRYDDTSMRRHHTFLFAVDARTVVDGNEQGNGTRFINHSCAPNCEVLFDKKRIFFRTLRNVEPGEELTYDYWYRVDDSYTEEDVKRIYPCDCGAKSCRGTLARLPDKKTTKRGGR